MCLIVLAWKARADLPLVIGANRDEWRERPTQAAHWWPDHPEIFAGRDLKAGGTWLGITNAGRFAAITNFRDPSDKRSDAKSRGGLVTDFLLSRQSPEEFLSALTPDAARAYNGFNLICGDGDALWCLSSRDAPARPITPGVHALSNHILDEPWPKVVHARAAMEGALSDPDPRPALERFLSDAGVAADDALPSTGVPREWEKRLSSALITGEDYGTRCTTFVTIDAQREAHLRELTRDAHGMITATSTTHDNKRRVA